MFIKQKDQKTKIFFLDFSDFDLQQNNEWMDNTGILILILKPKQKEKPSKKLDVL